MQTKIKGYTMNIEQNRNIVKFYNSLRFSGLNHKDSIFYTSLRFHLYSEIVKKIINSWRNLK